MDSTDRSVSCSAPYIGGAIVPSVTEGTGVGRWWACSHCCLEGCLHTERFGKKPILGEAHSKIGIFQIWGLPAIPGQSALMDWAAAADTTDKTLEPLTDSMRRLDPLRGGPMIGVGVSARRPVDGETSHPRHHS